MRKPRFSLALGLALGYGAALADAGHGATPFGSPGDPAAAERTVPVTLDDTMAIRHEPITIRPGETLRFVVTNAGALVHEFSIGDAPSQRAHALMMRKMPDMHHDGSEGNAVTLQPGETREVTWRFDRKVEGDIVLACQIPGHYDAGMVSRVPMEE